VPSGELGDGAGGAGEQAGGDGGGDAAGVGGAAEGCGEVCQRPLGAALAACAGGVVGEEALGLGDVGEQSGAGAAAAERLRRLAVEE
jgi:hypothetical protein